MRHFLDEQLGPSRAIASLSRRLKPPGSMRDPVASRSATQGLAALLTPALGAEPSPTVASRAKAKLNATSSANNEPEPFRRHGAPSRRFLDMELEL